MAYTTQILHSGTAVETYLAVDCTTGSTSVTLNDATGWPSPTGSQVAYGKIKPGQTGESAFTYTSRSGNVLSGVTWNADGTTSGSYTAGSATVVRHGFTANEATEANAAVLNTLGRVTTIGDLLYADSTTTLARVAMGIARQNFQVNSAATGYSFAASLQSLMTAQGDIVQASAANTPARLAIGTAFQVLGANSGATAVAYQASSKSTLTTTGDIMYASSANTPARLAIGTAYQQLITNAGATAPAWASSLQSLMTTTGDIVYASSANTPARLAAGTSGYVLTSGGAGVAPSWASSGTSALLALKSYTAATSWSITATSQTLVDGTNLVTPSFTVPASGQYLVRLSCLVNVPGSTLLKWQPMIGGVVVGPGPIQAAIGPSGVTSQPYVSVVVLVTGRTPGASEVIQWAAAVNTGTATMYSGTANGFPTIEVWSA